MHVYSSKQASRIGRTSCLGNILCYFSLLLISCSVVERSSRHELSDGYYHMKNQVATTPVFLECSDEQLLVYSAQDSTPALPLFTISWKGNDSLCLYPFSFSRVSLDLDITTLPFKFRFPRAHLPAQLNTDFNAALYAGRRLDRYTIRSRQKRSGNCVYESFNRGFDFGLFAGIGSTTINPFTTRGVVNDEYFAPLLQGGAAFFLESRAASFGLAMGWDRLLSPDRKYWIYSGKPWLGFIVGMALN
jgi:hypothetical protein